MSEYPVEMKIKASLKGRKNGKSKKVKRLYGF